MTPTHKQTELDLNATEHPLSDVNGVSPAAVSSTSAILPASVDNSAVMIPPVEPADPTTLFGKIHLHWFPGHMHKARKELAEKVSRAHLILEVRDARLPFSSAHPDFDKLFHQKRRIIIFNKSDLADPRTFPRIRNYYEARGQRVMFMSGTAFKATRGRRGRDDDADQDENESSSQQQRRLASMKATAHSRAQMRSLHSLIASVVGPRPFVTVPPVALVVGFPNVGKSTLINAFRNFSKQRESSNASKRVGEVGKEVTNKMSKGGVARVGAQPGVTRSISGFLVSSHLTDPRTKESSKLFLLDTPGILIPRIGTDPEGVELGLKLAAVACLPDAQVPNDILARYILWVLNRSHSWTYVRECFLRRSQPTTDLEEVLAAIHARYYRRTIQRSKLYHQLVEREKLWRTTQHESSNEERDDDEEDEDEDEDDDLDVEDDEDADYTMQQGAAATPSNENAKTDTHSDFLSNQPASHITSSSTSASARTSVPTPASLDPSSPNTLFASESAVNSTLSPSPSPSSPATLDLTGEQQDLCIQWWLKKFRQGKLGRVTLDHVPRMTNVTVTRSSNRRRNGASTRQRRLQACQRVHECSGELEQLKLVSRTIL